MCEIKRQKVLIIDDNLNEFYKIKDWIGTIGFKKDDVIPIDDDISLMEEASGSDPDICKFVEKQIRQNYKDIVLILCDCQFMRDDGRGYVIVKHIREKIKNLTPSNWGSMVPIIGMTGAVSKQQLEELYLAGADYTFEKKVVLSIPEESKTTQKIIKARVDMFERNLDSIYPSELKDKIISFKNKYRDKKTAFIMIDFRHLETAKEVRRVLHENGIDSFFANAPGGKNSKETWKNIEVFMHGCDFGIGIFADDSKATSKDGKKRNKINPNVCIEIGYMRGLQKEVLYLKDSSLEYSDLPSDFRGELSAEFSDDLSLEVKLTELLKDRGLNEKK